MTKQLVFLCGARDFHAMDWYRSSKELLAEIDISILTDLIGGEGFKIIVNKDDKVHKLFVLDKLLFQKQSSLGDKWRNLLKLIVLPLQVLLLRRFAKRNPNAIYHAHSMYYLVLARAAGVKYIGTPQGSDILVKPFKSKFYNWFAKYGLKKAKHITVDSINMQKGVYELAQKNAIIIQNGIDMSAIKSELELLHRDSIITKDGILSIRGFTALYRIKELLIQRNNDIPKLKIYFIYPFYDGAYKSLCEDYFITSDLDLGRVDRKKMYNLLSKSKLVVSIPSSDSSPRSVYEAIFCGCCVAVTENSYLEILPKCMLERIVIVDLNDKVWLEKAYLASNSIVNKPYKPSAEALEMFDQRISFKKIQTLLFD